MKKNALLITGFLLTNWAYAYLDPGTGSAIAGSLWPALLAFFSAVVAFALKYFWNPIKNLFSRKKEKS